MVNSKYQTKVHPWMLGLAVKRVTSEGVAVSMRGVIEVLQTLHAVSTAQGGQDYENNDFNKPSEKCWRVSGLKSGLKN